MDKLAFVFSGQGDQYPGMGKALALQYPSAADIYTMCDTIRPGTTSQCWEGNEEELKETKNTQPCLFAMELAAASVLRNKGLTPAAVAGFSLGELVAATVAGVFDPQTGFRLVCKRGELMQRAAEKYDTAMAAVVKLTAQQVQTLCDNYPQIYPVNFNCPGQITVSGLASQMPAFSAAVRAAGGRAIPLKVKGAFHSPFMRDAAEAFAQELKKTDLKRPGIPLYSNITARPYTDDIAGLLSKQICSPVQWEETIRNMLAEGISTFVEIGPGKTLTNIIQKINPDAHALSVTEYLAEETVC